MYQLIARFKTDNFQTLAVLKIPYRYDDDSSRNHVVERFMANLKIVRLAATTANLFIEFPEEHALAGQVFRKYKYGELVSKNAKKSTLSQLKIVYYDAQNRRSIVYSHPETDRTNPDKAAWDLWNQVKHEAKKLSFACVLKVDSDEKYINGAGQTMCWTFGIRQL